MKSMTAMSELDLLRAARAPRDSTIQGELSVALIKELVNPYVREHMRPELMGRVIDTICFVPLGSEQVRATVKLLDSAL